MHVRSRRLLRFLHFSRPPLRLRTAVSPDLVPCWDPSESGKSVSTTVVNFGKLLIVSSDRGRRARHSWSYLFQMNSDLFLTFPSSVKVRRPRPDSVETTFPFQSGVSSSPHIQYIYASSRGSFNHKSSRSIFIIFPMWQSVWQICGFEGWRLAEAELPPPLLPAGSVEQRRGQQG